MAKTVGYKLLERTLLHYLCFSDDKLINDAIKAAEVESESDEYKEKIKQLNDLYVETAINQKKDGTFVVTEKDRNNFLNIYPEFNKYLPKNHQGGKTKKNSTKKRRQKGGATEPAKLKEIHQYIVDNCDASKLGFDGATIANFKNAADIVYKKVKTDMVQPDKSNENNDNAQTKSASVKMSNDDEDAIHAIVAVHAHVLRLKGN